jgi:serine/threonine-protein kinase
VHRDLKPDNIFLARDPDGNTVVKVLDIGIAKMMTETDAGQSNALTGTGAMLGTPYYMAPEQLFSDETLDYRCDIWAFGIIFYECLAGKRPTRGDTFADIVKVIATHSMLKLEQAAPHVPPEIAALVGRMLSFNKQDRPQSLHDVLVVLRHYTDTMARSFGQPLLKQIKQTRDDPSSSGLRRSDLALLGESPQSTNDAVTIDAPASLRIAEELVPTRVVAPEETAVEAPPRRSSRRYLVALLVAAAALVAVRFALKTPAAEPTSTPPPTAAAVADAGAAPIVSVVANVPVVASSSPPSPPVRPVTTVRRPAPSPVAAPAPVVTTRSTATTSPGGLVEKPPF